ncbi:Yae1 domain-containing protein 1 [Amphibalanus amphitrite]|uniref:Yae1 domain-containing protein 1 n=1 Tax=Amphibalanus amphitrite TaxID=1232801 RepID=A0A6A4VJU4_AMPAM|nr:Yae1 domain-containing protein 1 [Amphibalanus amphitrite]
MEDGADDSALLELERKDWQKAQRRLLTDAYREGRSDGEESNLQQHFDVGYKDGLERVWPIAQLRGRLCAAIAVSHLREDRPELTEQAGESVSQLTELERKLGVQRRCGEEDQADISAPALRRRGGARADWWDRGLNQRVTQLQNYEC